MLLCQLQLRIRPLLMKIMSILQLHKKLELYDKKAFYYLMKKNVSHPFLTFLIEFSKH